MNEQEHREWLTVAGGAGCPLCAPRDPVTPDRFFVAQLSVSTLYLNGNQAYRGWCQLIFDPRHASALDELDSAEAAAFDSDLRRAMRAVRTVSGAVHLNVASLGNRAPHLHWHIIPRSFEDPRWGHAVWTTRDEEMAMLHLSEAELALLRDSLLSAL